METIVVRNPATGETLRELAPTPLDQIPAIFERARAAQAKWATVSLRKRANRLKDLREVIINRVDELAELISSENGKPRFEAFTNDLLPSVELLTYFSRRAPKVLRDRNIRITNPILLYRTSYLNHWPLGVVAVISPWNFPFLLPFGEIAMALVAGNAVVFKPSEVTPLIGLKIQELCEEAGVPPDLVQTVIGDGRAGAAIIDQKPAKIFFTGSVGTGKKIMEAASKNLIPVCLELGGKDAMIVTADADLDYATSAALWGSFGNSGQVCASTERLIVHESIAEPFLEKFKEKAEKLRQMPDPAGETDLTVATFDKQKAIYDAHVKQARDKGARFVTGGEFAFERKALKPTVVTGQNIEALDIYNEETFGPVVAVTKFRSASEAVEKANRSRYGLLGSVITGNPSLGEEIAKQLEVGTVTINEVMYTAGIPETPWGGLKESGFGRKHSDMGLMEFVNVRHIHKPRFNGFVFKSWWWFPYTPYQYATFRRLFDLYRRSWFAKLRALPLFLWNFVQFIKTEKRL